MLLGAGTPHKPPVIGAGGFVLHESTAYADYLMEQVRAGFLPPLGSPAASQLPSWRPTLPPAILCRASRPSSC